MATREHEILRRSEFASTRESALGNAIADALRRDRRAAAEYDEEAARLEAADRRIRQQTFFDWSQRIPEPKTGRLDFDRFPFQKRMYEEFAEGPEQVVVKATQAGASALLSRWAMYGADTRGITALYVFPTTHHVYDFADARVKSMISGSDYLRGRITTDDVQNKGLRKIGDGLVYFRGSEAQRGLDSVDADWLALDEYDTLNVKHIPDAERRITGSLVGSIRRVGVPTYPDYGISKLYDESDRRRWLVKCDCCSEGWQQIVYHDNVDEENLRIVCRRCKKPLDVSKGEWVAEFPERSITGWHITRLIVPRANLRLIVAAAQDREPYKIQVHHNKDLGEPYEPEESRITLETLQAAQSMGGGFTQLPAYGGQRYVTMGVDVASSRALNVRISEHLDDRTKRGIHIAECDSFDALETLMVRYRVNIACIDHLPEGRLARSFAERFPGRVYIVNFGPGQQKDVLLVDQEQRRVSVKRTEAIDAVITVMNQMRNLLPQDLPEGYVKHLRAMQRFKEADDTGKIVVGYRETGPTDYMQAEVYDLVAGEMWLLRQEIDRLQGSGELRPLDDFMEFERSEVNDYTDERIGLGPDESLDLDAPFEDEFEY